MNPPRPGLRARAFLAWRRFVDAPATMTFVKYTLLLQSIGVVAFAAWFAWPYVRGPLPSESARVLYITGAWVAVLAALGAAWANLVWYHLNHRRDVRRLAECGIVTGFPASAIDPASLMRISPVTGFPRQRG